jgi:hypothetical protein
LATFAPVPAPRRPVNWAVHGEPPRRCPAPRRPVNWLRSSWGTGDGADRHGNLNVCERSQRVSAIKSLFVKGLQPTKAAVPGAKEPNSRGAEPTTGQESVPLYGVLRPMARPADPRPTEVHPASPGTVRPGRPELSGSVRDVLVAPGLRRRIASARSHDPRKEGSAAMISLWDRAM